MFHGENSLSVMFAIAKNEAPPLRTLRADAPEEVELLIQRLLDKDPEQRPTALEAAKQLAALAGLRISRLALPAEGPPLAGSTASDTATTMVMTPTDATTRVFTPGASQATTVVGQAATPATPPAAAPARPVPSPRVLAAAAVAVLILGAAGAVFWRNRTAADQSSRRQEAVVRNNQAFESWKRGDLADARQKVTMALAADPKYGEALLNRAQIIQSAGDLDSAAVLYRELARTHANAPRLVAMSYYNLGGIALDSGTYDEAVEHLTQSLAHDSSSWEVYNNLGYALTQAGRPADALAPLGRGCARFPGAAALYKNTGLALLALDRVQEALAMADRALRLDADYASARGLRARLRARLGDLPGARADWRLYVIADPPPAPTERAEVASELDERGVDVELREPDRHAGRRRPRP